MTSEALPFRPFVSLPMNLPVHIRNATVLPDSVLAGRRVAVTGSGFVITTQPEIEKR